MIPGIDRIVLGVLKGGGISNKGADINGVNYTDFTPIHHAAEAGSPEAARVLIEAGADVNLPSNAGETPLERARREGHQEVVRLLEAAGAK